MGKNKDYREISRNNWKIKGVFFGNNGMVMRYAQRITKSSLGLLFSRSGIKQKKLGSSKVNIRIKKDLMKHGECVLHKVLISYFFLGSQTMPKFALLTGLEDAEFSQKQNSYSHSLTRSFPQLLFALFWANSREISLVLLRFSLYSLCSQPVWYCFGIKVWYQFSEKPAEKKSVILFEQVIP